MNAGRDMRRTERRVPAITLPESKAFSYALVLARNPHGEHTAFPWVMDLAIPVTEVGTKDKPHALPLLRNKFFHNETGLNSWRATSEPVAELQQKTQSAGLWDKSSDREQGELVLQETLPCLLWTFLFRSANITRIRFPWMGC